ncbi:hypothetical protein RB595_002091 [Gaeumannomyces hyphopodioides]
MDLNVPPSKHSFMLLTPFYMPTEDGEKWAIAFSAKEGVLVSAAISVTMGLIFTLLWNIFIFFTVLYQDKHFRRRYAALVTLWNSNDPWSAFTDMAAYTWHYFSPPEEQRPGVKPGNEAGKAGNEAGKAGNGAGEAGNEGGKAGNQGGKAEDSLQSPAPDQKATAKVTALPSNDKPTDKPEYPYKRSSWKWDCTYGFLLAAIALTVFGVDKAMGVVVPGLVVLGAVAPADPDSVYYPVPSGGDTDPAGSLRTFGLKAPAVMRALGSVEAAGATFRSKIRISTDTIGQWNKTESMHRVTYNYNVTGSDFGLQQGSILRVQVNGSCTTEYGWLREERPAADFYSLWDGKLNFSIPIDNISIADAPKASFLIPGDANVQYVRTGNMTFAILIWSAHRASISMGSNPWYATELRGAAPNAPYQAGFWIKRRRPVLACWQKDTWSYGDQTVTSVYDLKRLPGIKIPAVLLKVLEAAFATPLIVRLGNASGDSALRSRTTSPNGVIDAGASSISYDMERLIMGSFVATKNVFIDTTMYESNAGWPNMMQDSSGQAAAGAGDFVVTTPEVLTFSLTGLITLASLLVFLLAAETLISVGASKLRRSGNLIQLKALASIQLFRILFEPADENQADEKWSCEDRFPRADDTTGFALKECEKSGCRGHIKRTSEV